MKTIKVLAGFVLPLILAAIVDYGGLPNNPLANVLYLLGICAVTILYFRTCVIPPKLKENKKITE